MDVWYTRYIMFKEYAVLTLTPKFYSRCSDIANMTLKEGGRLWLNFDIKLAGILVVHLMSLLVLRLSRRVPHRRTYDYSKVNVCATMTTVNRAVQRTSISPVIVFSLNLTGTLNLTKCVHYHWSRL